MAYSQRETYETFVRAGWDSDFIVERPSMFSPAIAVQDRSNWRGGYSHFAQLLLPLEYEGWTAEATAHVRSCYIGDWTSLSKSIVRGADAFAFVAWLGLTDPSNFVEGRLKHHVQLDEGGRVASEGLLARLGDDEFLYTAGSTNWLHWQLSQGTWNAEATDVSPDFFIFGVQGPQSLFVLEEATGDSLRDIEFNHSRLAQLAGSTVRVLRTGISGELGYEVHGQASDANQVWTAIAEAGQDFGLCQIGIRTKPAQHIEAGIATNGLDYFPSSAITPGAPTQFRRGRPGGSFIPAGFEDYFRTPGELGWERRIGRSQHEFLGRRAFEESLSNDSTRVLRGLVWDTDDVVDLVAALFRAGDPPEQMEFPRSRVPSFDRVLANGVDVGVSTGRTVSLNVRATISLCVIDRQHAAAGTPVQVVWGRPNTQQVSITATVQDLPFKPDNRRTDVSALGR